VLLKAEFANRDRRLWPGGTVDVRLIAAEERGACVIPGAAVTNSQQGTFVYVLEPDTTVRQQMIAVRRMAGEYAVVDSGVHAGDVVVTDGQFRLSKGAKVILPVRPVTANAAGAK
jgi:multidrug efflux system membrane fusion protein